MLDNKMKPAGPMEKFIYKCAIITCCIALLLYFFYPRYEFVEPYSRFDKIKGIRESCN